MNPESLGPLFDPPPAHGVPLLAATLLMVLLPAAGIAAAGLLRGRLSRGGALAGLVLLPLVGYALGNLHVMDAGRDTAFCGSCHVMAPLEAALRIDDGSLAARHVARGAIPVRQACYGCHGGYGIWGGAQAKLAGVRHMLVNLTGRVQYPIAMYGRYDVAECLDCHAQTSAFRNAEAHRLPELQAALLDGSMACTGACHAAPHPESALAAPGAAP